jgi:quercetin dioxygenase-like cupin family protein
MASPAAPRTEIPGAQIFSLMDLVGYQPGSIVSRILFKREKGNVTLFAFAEGQGLSEHTAPFDALVQGIEGEGEVNISGQPFTVKPGEVILLPAQQPHAVKAITAFKMLLTMIRA